MPARLSVGGALLAKQGGGKRQSHGQFAATLGPGKEQGMRHLAALQQAFELLLDDVLTDNGRKVHDIKN